MDRKQELFDEMKTMILEMQSHHLLNQKKFLETKDRAWITRNTAIWQQIAPKYDKLVREYKALGGAVLEDFSFNEDL